jgi:threonine aldolase
MYDAVGSAARSGPGHVVDLRSDTVTLPSPAMREAMYRAELGDDVFCEDPTVNRLEELAAERLGKEAAVLVTSGTQGNLVALLTHTQRGDEVICTEGSHILVNEVAGAAALGSLQLRPVPARRGMPDLDAIRLTIRGDNVHYPRTALVCVENTHNRQNGSVLSAAQMNAVGDLAHGVGIAFHVDGARIFNAAVALGVPVSDVVAAADSVTFCLSKGLSCPVGSVLCGSNQFIGRARKYRKMVGGGMRQAGVFAAAGIVALEEMIERMAEDHQNARTLAEGLAQIPGVEIDPAEVVTNIVYFSLKPGTMSVDDFRAGLAQEGVRISGGGNTIRLVTHYGITADDARLALRAIESVMRVPALR